MVRADALFLSPAKKDRRTNAAPPLVVRTFCFVLFGKDSEVLACAYPFWTLVVLAWRLPSTASQEKQEGKKGRKRTPSPLLQFPPRGRCCSCLGVVTAVLASCGQTPHTRWMCQLSLFGPCQPSRVTDRRVAHSISCSPFHVRVVFLPTHGSFQVLLLSTNSHFSKREFSHPSRPRVLFSAYPKWATMCTHASLVSIP